jgi:hypothetical protein
MYFSPANHHHCGQFHQSCPGGATDGAVQGRIVGHGGAGKPSAKEQEQLRQKYKKQQQKGDNCKKGNGHNDNDCDGNKHKIYQDAQQQHHQQQRIPLLHVPTT